MRRRVEVREQLSEAAGLKLVRLKTRASQRTVALGSSVIDELARHAERFGPADPERFVFTSSTGGPIRLGNWRRRVWAPTVRSVGLEPTRVHDLRHFAASVAIAAGAHPKQVQSRLGHSNITTTLDRYGHLFPTLDADLADRIDELHTGSHITPLRRSS
jgi:integrase